MIPKNWFEMDFETNGILYEAKEPSEDVLSLTPDEINIILDNALGGYLTSQN